MRLKTYLLNRIDSRKFRLNGIWPSTRLPNKRKLCQAFRDHILYSPNELPHKVDLRNNMTPVEDQSKIGSCAANCLAGAYEYLTKTKDGRNTDVSRLFIYYNSRAKDNHSGMLTDSGCTMTSAIEALEEFGTCLESIWPYEISKVNSRPSDRAFQEASNHKITEALQIEIDLYEMKSCLAQGFPFAFGLQLFKSFDKASTMGVVPMPNMSDRIRSSHGSHALLAVGYSDHSKSFIVRNSWGEAWGEKGYCYIPYDYMTNPELCFDVWAVRKLANDNLGKEHWDNVDAFNYLKAATIAIMSMDSNKNNDDDDNSCAIEDIDEEDEPNKSGSYPVSDGRNDQWQNNPGWERCDNNGGDGRPWYQRQDVGNSYPGYGASSFYGQQQDNGNPYPGYGAPSFYGQQQQYDGRVYNYDQQQPPGTAGFDQYQTGFPPNNNFGGHFQNPYPGNFQGPNLNYESHSNHSQYPMYGNGQYPQNAAYYAPPANIMNFPADGNQQHGSGFGYNNTQYSYPPNQYGQ